MRGRASPADAPRGSQRVGEEQFPGRVAARHGNGDLASGNFATAPVLPVDWMRIAELVARYHDLPLGTVDASVVALAERLDLDVIATLDRQHFTVVRSRHGRAFAILP